MGPLDVSHHWLNRVRCQFGQLKLRLIHGLHPMLYSGIPPVQS